MYCNVVKISHFLHTFPSYLFSILRQKEVLTNLICSKHILSIIKTCIHRIRFKEVYCIVNFKTKREKREKNFCIGDTGFLGQKIKIVVFLPLSYENFNTHFNSYSWKVFSYFCNNSIILTCVYNKKNMSWYDCNRN